MSLDLPKPIGGWLPDVMKHEMHQHLFGFDEPPHGSDDYWMLTALRASMRAAPQSSPNPAVGCVLVSPNNHLISQGATSSFGGLHAEANALATAKSGELVGATAYVTLEPCCHSGNQGPCADKLINAGIQRCIVGVEDPNPLVSGNGIRRLLAAGIEVEVGILREQCQAWLYAFLIHIEINRPIIALKWAQSADGCLARDNGDSKWISSPTSRTYTHWLRQKYDAIMVGAGTALQDHPSLTVRDCQVETPHHPIKIVFDPNGRLQECDLPIKSQLLKSLFTEETKIIYCCKKPVEYSWLLQTNVYQLNDPELNPAQLLKQLQDPELIKWLGKPIQSIMVEGGARLIDLFVEANLWDFAHVFNSPKKLGGTKYKVSGFNLKPGKPPFQEIYRTLLDDDILQEFINTEHLAPTEPL